MVINTKGEAISQEEVNEYVKYVEEKNPGKEIAELNINVNGDFVDLGYSFYNDVPFERIRRITGYLVGTLDRFNDGKRAEEKDRVKHDTCCSLETFDD